MLTYSTYLTNHSHLKTVLKTKTTNIKSIVSHVWVKVTTVAGQKERAPTAVNRLDCAAYELNDLLSLLRFCFQIFLVGCCSVASICDVIDWSSRVTATQLFYNLSKTNAVVGLARGEGASFFPRTGTTVINNNIDNQGAHAPSIQILPTTLNA